MKTLKKGSKGEDVELLQKLLKISVDGDFGQKTHNALVAWQNAHGLVADGIVGPKTWAALGVKEETTNPKCVDPSVVYAPLKCCISKSPNRSIKYLAIHYTAGASSAPGRAKNMKTAWEKAKRASADFGVDDRDMVQFNPDLRNYYCWAVSGGNGIYNSNSISIEMCSNLKKGTSVKYPNHEGWYFTEATLSNAVRLAKILMAKFNIPLERVVRHYDVTGKICPGVPGWTTGRLFTTSGERTSEYSDEKEWLKFKNRLV